MRSARDHALGDRRRAARFGPSSAPPALTNPILAGQEAAVKASAFVPQAPSDTPTASLRRAGRARRQPGPRTESERCVLDAARGRERAVRRGSQADSPRLPPRVGRAPRFGPSALRPSRSLERLTRMPSGPLIWSASSAHTGTEVSISAIVRTSASKPSEMNPPSSIRSRTAASIGVLVMSGSRPI